ncbi:hypothetical protein ABN249_11280 [Providencia rettgeri]
MNNDYADTYGLTTVLSPDSWVIVPNNKGDTIGAMKYPNSLKLSKKIGFNPFDTPLSLIDMVNHQFVYYSLFRLYLNKAIESEKYLLGNIESVLKCNDPKRNQIWIKYLFEVKSLLSNLEKLNSNKFDWLIITNAGLHFFESMNYILENPDISSVLVNTSLEK